MRKNARLEEANVIKRTKTAFLINFNNFLEILYLIFDYPHKHYTFKHFEI